MKKQVFKISDTRGSGDLKSLKAEADDVYSGAQKAGTLRVMHPVSGKVVSWAAFNAEITERHKQHAKASEFWSTPLKSLGGTALAHEAVMPPNHQPVATAEDRLNEIRAAYPGDSRHLVRVDAA